MKFKKPFYAFINMNKTVAVIQAKSKQIARERAQLISHIVKVPETCKVKAVKRGTVRNAPIFFEGHLLAIEDAIAEADSNCINLTVSTENRQQR